VRICDQLVTCQERATKPVASAAIRFLVAKRRHTAALMCDITMSLDGFVAGPNQSLEHPLGEGGERRPERAYVVASWRERHGEEGGASIATPRCRGVAGKDGGRRDGQEHVRRWRGRVGRRPLGRAAAGDRDVLVAGGGSAVQQYLAAGLLDDLQIHLVPMLLGAGVRLLDNLGDARPELECTRVIESPSVTHLFYRVVR
jgi:hypothetical protein